MKSILSGTLLILSTIPTLHANTACEQLMAKTMESPNEITCDEKNKLIECYKKNTALKKAANKLICVSTKPSLGERTTLSLGSRKTEVERLSLKP